MREKPMPRLIQQNSLILIGVVTGITLGFFDHPALIQSANIIVDTFMRLLKLVSMPLIFMAVLSTITGMGSFEATKRLGGSLIKLTLITTIIAAVIALIIYLILDPASHIMVAKSSEASIQKVDYITHLKNTVPDNFFQPFIHTNPVSLLFLAFIVALAILFLPEEQKAQSTKALKLLFAIVMSMTRLLLKCLPIAMVGFFAQFIHSFPGKEQVNGIGLFLLCVLMANLIQAIIVLPGLVMLKGLSPWKIFCAMKSTLLLAFLSKSSSAALPSTIENMEKNLHLSPRITRLILPLCITVNMNACAAFILITTLFVSMANGVTFTGWELIGSILLATIAAIGNAGVPMGCFMLSSSILISMNVPIQLMGVILPFYALIDMLESAINVWSDSCVTAMVAKKHNAINTEKENKMVSNTKTCF